MGYFINSIKEYGSFQRDIKELIPEMNMRRRMSRVVKMGVSTGLESLMSFGGEVDAIVTATGLGCIADSEKFLATILASNEQQLNPTPFINSTFNTVGAQIAQLAGLHCYNNTFTHRHTSFESALFNAMLRIKLGKSERVLVGVFDEATPTVERIMTRMGLLKNIALGEGAVFFVLTLERSVLSVAEIEELTFGATGSTAISVSAAGGSLWCGAVAQLLFRLIAQKNSGSICNDMGNKNNSLIKFRCL